MRLNELSNDELLSSLKAVLGDEKRLIAKVIAYLVEVEDRRLHLELACSSMFEFCTRRLGLSEGEAFRRLTAARLVQRFPVLLDAIASGRLILSAVVLLRDLFTDANVGELVAAAAGKTKREVEELVARLAPRPDVEASIRKLPQPLPLMAQLAHSRTAASTNGPQLSPLAQDRYRVQLTASGALRDKLEHARALMRHRNPTGDLANVVERALDVLIEKLEKEKLGKTARPRATRAPTNPAHISRATRREVTFRDGCQCAYVSANGERCQARDFLELDHRHPKALGGMGEVENIRMLCRAHNRYAAERAFGRDYVEKRIHLRREKCAPPERRELVQKALVSMGFARKETERALAAIDPATWSRPLEALVREALGTLT